MREIVLDTETTGLSPKDGDRLVEIGCLELINHVPTGETYHQYINPRMPMPSAAQDVHGLSDEFLADKPEFSDIVEAFLEFIGDAQLIIHNAAFDMGFINAELSRIDGNPIPHNRAVDTVSMARKKFPGSPASLNALCRRFNIDNSARTLHGALLDAELLAEVYLELIGGRQPGLVLSAEASKSDSVQAIERVARAPRPHQPTAEELAAHAEFIARLNDPMWNK
ncbi:MAG: DNA polymerase III subunit epsilon [Rhodospirillaceae bacterium]|nr:DNA polymerase III subunit epsilon [Rhodospirillaceae bacterium]|tara:strand:- start:12512 stop:13183 length:672 start_codon:yes stop_codon:yes gene_type:complete